MKPPIDWRAPGLEATHPHLNEFLEFLPDLNKESDRGMALIGTSFIDELLLRTIRAFLIKGKASEFLLEGAIAPLGSLATRANAANALGLISDREFLEVERLRKVRNLFAHKTKASFSDQKIQDICRSLTFAAQDTHEFKMEARGQFSTSLVSLILNLVNRESYVAKQRIVWAEWAY